jgi:P4 family phage/plasmid primase-like protien
LEARRQVALDRRNQCCSRSHRVQRADRHDRRRIRHTSAPSFCRERRGRSKRSRPYKRLKPAAPALYLTRGSSYPYNPDAEAPIWWQFLVEALGGEEAATVYESDLGYSITGERREHVFFVDYGPTARNGKTTAHEAVKHVVGAGLVNTSKPGAFLVGRHEDPKRPRSDIIRWKRKRIIQTSELPESATLDEDLVKRLTGEDTIEAREVYGPDEREHAYYAKLWIRTNNFPALDPDSEAIWGRVRLHGFHVSFKGREDKDLSKKLRAEGGRHPCPARATRGRLLPAREPAPERGRRRGAERPAHRERLPRRCQEIERWLERESARLGT